MSKIAPRLKLIPVTRDEANAKVREWHRHHKPVVGYRFALGAELGGRLVGVAICGRPVARRLDDGRTLEITRVATDGTRNACSFLYGACRRAAAALGYTRLDTYTLPEEGGASLRAAGFVLVKETGGGSWSREGRPRETLLVQTKLRWEAA